MQVETMTFAEAGALPMSEPYYFQAGSASASSASPPPAQGTPEKSPALAPAPDPMAARATFGGDDSLVGDEQFHHEPLLPAAFAPAACAPTADAASMLGWYGLPPPYSADVPGMPDAAAMAASAAAAAAAAYHMPIAGMPMAPTPLQMQMAMLTPEQQAAAMAMLTPEQQALLQPTTAQAILSPPEVIDEDKQLRRMRRNRDSAAASRNRKKQHVDNLECQVASLYKAIHHLQTENHELRAACNLFREHAGQAASEGVDAVAGAEVLAAAAPAAAASLVAAVAPAPLLSGLAPNAAPEAPAPEAPAPSAEEPQFMC